MKTLLFIVLNVLEVAAYVFVICMFTLFTEWIGLDDWIDNLSQPIALIIFGIPFILCIIFLIKVKVFQGWVNINKKWVNQIIDKD